MNCHCGKRLVPDKELQKKGRKNVFTCTCGCSYCLVIAYKGNECAKKENGKPRTKPKPKKRKKKKNEIKKRQEEKVKDIYV